MKRILKLKSRAEEELEELSISMEWGGPRSVERELRDQSRIVKLKKLQK